MHEHDAAEYGRHVAEDYDEIYGDLGDVEGAVARLVELVERSGGGPLLELGVGTGRLALPLVEAGVAVTGVDGSPAMLDHLLAKPGGDRVATVVGDFSTLDIPGRYAVIALVANTIYALPDQEAQVRTFRQAAAHLEPGGRFVVEAWVPPCLPAGPALLPRLLPRGMAGVVVADHDPAGQRLATTQVVLGGRVGLRVFPVVHRYAWPAELDLMARLAGMVLEDRWADWRGTPFTGTSTDHVSVYRLPPGS